MQNQNHHQKPQWKEKRKHNEDSWQEALNQVAEKTRKEKKYEENERQQEELIIKRE